MKPLILLLCFGAVACYAASDPVAARLAQEAHQAEKSGQYVRAYLLYAEAAARDPKNPTYQARRDSLATAAKLLSKAQIQTADISADIAEAKKEAESGVSEPPPLERVSEKIWKQDNDLQPLPHLHPSTATKSFDLRGDERSLFPQVVEAYGIHVVLDHELHPEAPIVFEVKDADFRTAMEALTLATHTFMFPLSETQVFVARNTESKRRELEPQIVMTVNLPNAVEPRELIDATTAVRGALHMQAIGWDSTAHALVIRDRVTRARAARSLLEALVLPKAQVSIRIQLLSVDINRSYHYGLSMPTSYPMVAFGHLGGLQSIISDLGSAATFISFGGGASLFGLGVSDATFFATYSRSFANQLYDATVVAENGQAATFHVGDKYPIPQTLYTGYQQSASSIYNPIGQVTLEDLGLILKLTPYVNGDGDVSMHIAAQFKALGAQSIDSVPEITQREFEGDVRLRQDEWAIIAGIDETTYSIGRTGLVGLTQIPGLSHLLSENTRSEQTTNALIVVQPTITRLPMSSWISPQFLLGPSRGETVIL